MLQINMADVMNVIGSLTPYLIAIGVLFALALIITFAVNKKTVKEVATRKIVHSESWLVALVGIVVAVSMMLTGPLSTLLNNATTTKYMLSDTTVSKANELAKEVQSEAITMLKNDDSNLPLSNKKVNVFGWGSTNPVYGGTGSGSMSKQYKTVSLLDGMKQAGLKTNTELSKLYTDYRKDRPEVGMFAQDWTLPEVPAKQYSDKLVSDAKDFSDEAVVVLTRVGGEGADLPTDMKAKGITYKNNSKDYDDFQKGESFLQLSKTERDMIDLVTSNFKKVTLVYNGANTFQFDFLNDYPQIQSVVWCPPAGQTGFSALGEVLAGETNPSGKTSDTFLKNLTKSVSYNNFGKFEYTNMADKAAKYKGFTGDDVTAIPGFVNYSEGIYVGYKFYETASDEGLINYDDTVAFPFGYGLSYTSFDQKLDSVKYKGGKVTVTATVTNTGDKAGKDVVEVYYNPPYTDGGIEKASKNLAGFEKTKELQPGESQKVTVKFDDDDMASYDYKGAKAYVLEKGDYDISIQSDSHHVIDHKAITVKDTVTYDSDSNTHNGDKTVATNQFDDVAGDVTYLSRADHFANYKEATAAPTNFKMSDKAKETFYNNSNYDPKKFDKDSDKMPTTGAKNGLKLSDMYGKDYDDADWDKLLDQLTFDDMDNLIANGGYGTQAVKSVGKIQLTDADGPASLNNNFTGVGSIGFPASTAFACTWNKDLAKQFGEMIGDMAHDMHVAGWYAPAMNIHRNAFSGRTFEYFSEDSLLSGVMASSEISGAKSKGVYSFMKHFALNDQETKRTEMLCTWTNEQAMREIYLKPFEMSVKEGGAQAVMSSFNYIGNTYAGADSALLQTVLRGEWGFKGFVLT
ncbi:glycoside hydrolase family 3 N-terminal domain-containing protein, partial [Bifidobacterium adolescentis]|uniref:glycoside hydrolase family 3 protein n=1 Tax=Bifidobacterium adolescentis TaxID=1680 RepID=UPI003B991F8C